jgi:hypothetical protein
VVDLSQLPPRRKYSNDTVYEQWIAAGNPVKLGNQSLIRLLSDSRLDHIAYFGLAEANQRQLMSFVKNLLDKLEPLGGAAQLGIAISADDQDLGFVNFVCDESQQRERCKVGIVQVIDPDYDRIQVGDSLKKVGYRIE